MGRAVLRILWDEAQKKQVLFVERVYTRGGNSRSLQRDILEGCKQKAQALGVPLVASARDYDEVKDRTQADVKDLYTQAVSERDLVELFSKDIIPKSEQTLDVSLDAYRVGQTDFLQLVDNWRQLLKFRVMLSQQESQLRQTLSTLERVVGGMMPLEQAMDTSFDVQVPDGVQSEIVPDVLPPKTTEL